MRYNFQNLKDVFSAIKENNFDRSFVSSLAMDYIYEDKNKFVFNEQGFSSNGFIIDFFNVEQYDYSDKEFKEIILNLMLLDDYSDLLKVKSVIYNNYLKAYQEKLEKRTISYDTYNILVKKVLS
jgi:hypothetical protein